MSGCPRILVVDDDDPVRAMLADTLEARGFAVLEAPDLPSAEDVLLGLRGGPVDLVLFDLNLAGLAGMQDGLLLYERWASLPGRPAFLLMSSMVEAELLPAVRAGRLPYIPKPFPFNALEARIRGLLRPRASAGG